METSRYPDFQIRSSSPWLRRVLFGLLPLLLLALVLITWKLYISGSTLRDPRWYPEEFEVQNQASNPQTITLPLALNDSTWITWEMVNRNPERSWAYFHNSADHSPISPYWNSTKPDRKPAFPIIESGRHYAPDVALTIQRNGKEPLLVPFKHIVDSTGTGRYITIPVFSDDSTSLTNMRKKSRLFELNLSGSGYTEIRSFPRYFGELLPEYPGPEILVSVEGDNEDFGRHFSQLLMYNVYSWKRIWRKHLPGQANYLTLLYSGDSLSAFRVITSASSIGNEVDGLSDRTEWLLAFDFYGRQLDPPMALQDAKGKTRHVCMFPHPHRHDQLIIAGSEYRNQGDAERSLHLELRERGDFRLLRERWYDFPAEDRYLVYDDTRAWVLVSGRDQSVHLINVNLELEARIQFRERVYFLDHLTTGHGDNHALRLLFGTESGRLLVLDSALRILSADYISQSAVSANPLTDKSCNRYAVSCQSLIKHPVPRFLNTSAGSFTGHFVTRSRVFEGSVIGAIIALILSLVYYGRHMRRSWLKFQATTHVMIESSPDAVLLLNPDGTVRRYNREFAALRDDSEVSAQRGRALPFSRLIESTQLEQAFHHLKSGDQGTLDLLKHNEPVTLHYRFQAMQAGGKIQGYALILQDVTRHLEETRRVIWTFMAQNIAHRLKSPLQRIGFAVEAVLVKMKKDQLSPGFLKKSQNEILATSQEMNRIIHNFLMISEQRVELRPLDLQRFLLRNVQNYREMMLADRTQILMQIEEKLPRVQADEYHLLTVLVNLLDNAQKALAGNGEIHITARKLTGEHANSAVSGVRLNLRDTGSGIPEELLPRVFQPHESFFSDGHGIGLAVVYNIVQAHGGNIQVRNHPDGGAEFTIDLLVASD